MKLFGYEPKLKRISKPLHLKGDPLGLDQPLPKKSSLEKEDDLARKGHGFGYTDHVRTLAMIDKVEKGEPKIERVLAPEDLVTGSEKEAMKREKAKEAGVDFLNPVIATPLGSARSNDLVSSLRGSVAIGAVERTDPLREPDLCSIRGFLKKFEDSPHEITINDFRYLQTELFYIDQSAARAKTVYTERVRQDHEKKIREDREERVRSQKERSTAILSIPDLNGRSERPVGLL